MRRKTSSSFIASLLLPLLLTGPALAGKYNRLSVEQLQALAGRGDQAAQVELATALEHGEGLKKDIQGAIGWYCRAARQGSGDAQRSLGWIYANGKGVPRDDQLAAYWLGKAAASGDDYAARIVKHFPKTAAPPENNGCSHVAATWLTGRCKKSACGKIVDMVKELAVDYGLDANLVLAVISAESAFDPRALSPMNARGLMQLMPATAKRFGVENSWDKEQNLRGGMAYLRWLLAYFGGNVEHALAGYNAGEQRVKQYRGIPPFAETKAYVKRIIGVYGKRFHRFEKSWLTSHRPAGDPVARTEKSGGAYPQMGG